jgi:uncharacterized protein
MTPRLEDGSRARTLRWLAAWAVFGAGLGAWAPAAQALDVPPLSGHVSDHAHLLPPDRAAALEARLAAHEQSTQQQFALLTLPSLQGDSIEDLSIRVAEAWKLGNKDTDQGLIMIVVPGEHKIRIEVGHGLEGAIPDAIAARVIRDVLAPAFQQGDYAGGVDAAFGALMHQSGGEGTPMPEREKQRGRGTFPGTWILFLFFILLPFLSRLSGGPRGRSGLRGRGGFMPIFWGGGGGGWGGGGGGWGGGGGGFSGGGGSFGGGGASGDW